jgi:aminopeptidase-like protein
MAHVLKHSGDNPSIIDFSPYGYDERQYCSPGFDLAVGLFQRSKFGTFPEYHTSADDLDFIKPEHLEASFRLIACVIQILEGNLTYENTSPKGEPQLGKRGLYGAIGGSKDAAASIMTMLWVLNLSDRGHSLLDIAERAQLPFPDVSTAAELLLEHGLLRRA